jgi:hypothetical protein
MSEKEMKKENQIAGKGQNVTLEIVNALRETRAVTESVDGHVPETRGT